MQTSVSQVSNRMWLGLFIALLFIGYAGSESFAAGNARNLVRIEMADKADLIPKSLDITGYKPGVWVDAVVTEQQITDLTNRGLAVQLLHSDVDQILKDAQAYYPSWSQFQADLEAIVTSNPAICRMDTIGYSYESLPIQAVKLSDNVEVDEDEPEVLFTAMTHAREWSSLAVTMFILDSLANAYGADVNVTEVVDSREIFFVPCLNPDGYVYTHDEGNDWRKNRRPFPEYGTVGVDLNRNYAGSVDGNPKGEWGTTIGSVTHYPNESVYCGPAPFSELETQAHRDLILSRDFCAGLSYHGYGELVLWSWGYTTYWPPNQTYISILGTGIANVITQEDYTGTYTPQSSSALKLTSGDATDWGYGCSHYVRGKDFLHFTVEVGQEYHPPTENLEQVVRENFDGAYYLLIAAGTIRDDLSPRIVPPALADIDSSTTGTYTVGWSQAEPEADLQYWQIDQLSDLSVVTDNVEESTGHWNLQGFTVSAQRAHSGSHSFKSSEYYERSDAVTTLYPYYVLNGDSLTFWAWYDIQSHWDCGYAEVSRDDRNFDVLKMYTGQSGDWVRQALSLEDYVGESVVIRFRYTTDTWVQEEGLYIDDIQPVPLYSDVTTLSSAVTDTFYDITSQPSGTYYYRVRGFNSEWNWCDYSTIEPAEVLRENEGKVAGFVTDSIDGTQLTGILVELLDQSTVIATDSTLFGTYSIPGVVAGTYDLKASAELYETKTLAGVVVNAQQVLTVDLTLAANWGAITGIVTDAISHAPVESVVVDIIDSDVIVKSGISNADGVYSIDSIVSGAYDLTCTHADYDQLEVQDVVIIARETLDFDLAMSPFFVCGDADASGDVDIDDAVHLINYIFAGGPPPDPIDAGDADCSGDVDIDDVVYLISYIFSGGNPPCDTDDDGMPDC